MQTHPRRSKLVFGSFPAEESWLDAKAAALPRVAVVRDDSKLAMDELLFALCGPNDKLCTRFPRSPMLKAVLQELGFSHLERVFEAPKDVVLPVCELMLSEQNREWIKNDVEAGYALCPYSVNAGTHNLCRAYKITQRLPSLASVINVNSKAWSHELRESLGYGRGAVIARSAKELWTFGQVLLANGSIVVKEEFGVAGGGNRHVDSEKQLAHLTKQIAQQESRGLGVCLVVEPYLRKEFDFSAQVTISETGDWHLLSLQGMRNEGFSYRGSFPLGDAQAEKVEQSDYFRLLGLIAKKIFEEGYFGPVCVDSMFLESGELFPIVEINSRFSLGMINHFLDVKLRSFGKRSFLAVINLREVKGLTFEHLIEHLNAAGILFLRERPSGVVPLASGTIMPAPDTAKAGLRSMGKLFFAVPFHAPEDIPVRTSTLKRVLDLLNHSHT